MNESNIFVIGTICGIGIVIIIVIGMLTIISPKFREWIGNIQSMSKDK
jgi:hypothetical protein